MSVCELREGGLAKLLYGETVTKPSRSKASRAQYKAGPFQFYRLQAPLFNLFVKITCYLDESMLPTSMDDGCERVYANLIRLVPT